MGRSVSITVHPAALGAEYLSVSDAMQQMLDLVSALERTEASEPSERQIVWRLTEAHTNSPPFTITAEAFPADPAIALDAASLRVPADFIGGLRELLAGRDPEWLDDEAVAPLKRALQRNLNGVGRSAIRLDDEDAVDVVPQSARVAVAVLEHRAITALAAEPDYSRTEYGSVEVLVYGVTRWNDRPALSVQERLSRDKLTCVLDPDVAEELGPHRNWSDAWQGSRLLVGGALHYGADGSLKRIDASSAELRPWTDVPMSDLRDIDVLSGRSVSEHLRLIRGEDRG